jgi:hypothetical protein
MAKLPDRTGALSPEAQKAPDAPPPRADQVQKELGVDTPLPEGQHAPF